MEQLAENAENSPTSPLAVVPSSLMSTKNTVLDTIDELLNVKYNQSVGPEIDIATTIRNAILIPNNLNVSDDCLRVLCNANSSAKDAACLGLSISEDGSSDVISDQDNSSSGKVNDQIIKDCSATTKIPPEIPIAAIACDTYAKEESLSTIKEPQATTDYVVIQIEPEEQQVADVAQEIANKSITDNVSFEYTNEKSPELFDDDEPASGAISEENRNDVPEINTEPPTVDKLAQRDNHLFKQIQSALSGVLPPPGLTNVAITLDVILSKYKQHSGQLIEELSNTKKNGFDLPEDVKKTAWPEVKNVNCHDVYYNLSNAIEQFEYLTVKYTNRFIGADTASSFVVADVSSAKKRANRTKALKQNSPGRRLSHLARRRAVFSCANLMGSKEALAGVNSKTTMDPSKMKQRQILMPVRRKGCTPSRKNKSPKKIDVPVPPQNDAQSRLSSKRCLFQSPGKAMRELDAAAKPKITPELVNRVDKSKRALFSSPKLGALASGVFGKRKRTESSDDEENKEQTKFQRTDSVGGSESAKRRNNFIRSQSFTVQHVAKQMSSSGLLPRTSSEIHISCSSSQSLTLTDSEKKKLLWNVSQTLQRNQVSGSHPKFKDYATVMAKVVKRLYLQNVNRNMNNASDLMNRLSNKIAFQVVQGKKEHEILAEERRKSQTTASQKLSGYINPDDYQLYIASRNINININVNLTRSTSASHIENSENISTGVATKSTTDNANPGYSVLRENVDIEQRQQIQRLSSQKNLTFSGKDQKNVSPYSGGDGAKRKLLVGGATTSSTNSTKSLNIFKAKRQISFDT